VAVDVQDVGAVLVRARAEEEVGEADSVLAAGRELTLSALGCGDRLRVNAEIAKQCKRVVLSRVVSRRGCAVEDLEAGDRTQTRLAVTLDVVRVSPGRATVRGARRCRPPWSAPCARCGRLSP